MPEKNSKNAKGAKAKDTKKAAPKASAKAAPKATSKAGGTAKKGVDFEKLKAFAQKQGLKLLHWTPERLAHFVGGNLTLAGLHGMSNERLYDMAQVAFRLLTQGKLDDAEKIFAGLAVMNPYDGYFQLSLGSIAQRRNDLAKAETFYTRSIEINNRLPVGYTNRGEVRLMQQNLAGAIEDFRRAAELDPDAKDQSAMRARVMLVAISEKLGNGKQAKKAR